MPESHDPMCSVPLSYLTMLQERQGGYTVAYRPDRKFFTDNAKPMEQAIDELAYKLVKKERDDALARIAEFEERAGCKLEQIPVEALGEAQNAYVNQQAIDTLKRENESLQKRLNAQVSQPALTPMAAPWGVKKDGTPKKRPGRKAPRKRAA